MSRIFILIALLSIKSSVSKDVRGSDREISRAGFWPTPRMFDPPGLNDKTVSPKDENSEKNLKMEILEENHEFEIPEEKHEELLIQDSFDFNSTSGYQNSNNKISCSLHNGKLPDRFDWREKKKVTPARDQKKNCDACWAFSMTATIESHMMIYRGANERLDLSEQMLIDCLENSPGCDPGSIIESYSKLVSKIGAMVTEKEYPYEEGQGECHKFKYNPKLSIAGFKRVRQDEEEMKRHIVTCGPLTAAINSESMKNYNEAVIDEPTEDQCPSNKLDHAVEIVGYDYYRDDKTVDKSKQYWIIKNSWGKKFGANGYYYLVLGRNACGIANDVTVPLVN